MNFVQYVCVSSHDAACMYNRLNRGLLNVDLVPQYLVDNETDEPNLEVYADLVIMIITHKITHHHR